MKTFTLIIYLIGILTLIKITNQIGRLTFPPIYSFNHYINQHNIQNSPNNPVQKQLPSGLVDLTLHYYKNNLKAQNWYYGSTNQNQYKIRLFNEATKFNLTFCPFERPFVTKDLKTCINCPTEKPLFNLGEGVCEMCPYQHYFDQVQGNCTQGTPPIKKQQPKPSVNGVTNLINRQPSIDPNINKIDNTQIPKTDNGGCQQNQVFNSSTKICEAKIYVINEKAPRIILPSASYLIQESQKIKKNNEARLVFDCPNQKPYLKNKSCISCPQFQYFKMLQQICVKDCQVYTIYDEKTKLCVNATFLTSPDSANLILSVTPFEIFSKKIIALKQQKPFTKYCPQTAPYFVDSKCIFCGNQNPYFDIDLNQCVNCQNGRWYDSKNRKCMSSSSNGLSIQRIVMNIF